MNPGRDLDALVAEKVMGWSELKTGLIVETGWDLYGKDSTGDGDFLVPEYSTDIAAAWDITEKMRHIKCKQDKFATFTVMQTEEGYWAGYTWHEVSYDDASGHTAPHAICLAALKAVGVEV